MIPARPIACCGHSLSGSKQRGQGAMLSEVVVLRDIATHKPDTVVRHVSHRKLIDCVSERHMPL